MNSPAITPRRMFLQPAGAVVAENHTMVHTVLGSCVAITMRVPRLSVALMAHCLLPAAGVPAGSLPPAEALKYVDTTVDLMLGALTRRGATLTEIEVKIFGGADRIAAGIPDGGYCVGSRNVEAALAALEGRGMVIAARGVGGEQGRVIDFDTHTGEVRVRRLPARIEKVWS